MLFLKTVPPFFRRRFSVGVISSLLLLGASGLRAFEASRVIGDVTVEGNRFMKKRAVLSKVTLRKGEVVVDPNFRKDVDRLLETELYDDVQVSTEEMAGTTDAQGRPLVRVVFHVQERPIIRRVDFKGNVKLSDRKFQDDIASKAGDPFTESKAQMDVQKILGTYREEGYADARVEYYTSLNPKTNKAILTFFITEGNRVLVDSVEIEGNQTFSDKKIRKTMKKTRRKKVFKEENLEEDIEEIKNFYKNRGFLQVDVSTPALIFNEDHTKAKIALSIHEGRRFTVGGFSFQGATLFTESQLRKAVTLKPARLFQQDKLEESRQNIQELYADKGYLMAHIDPQTITQDLDAERGKVDILFDIVESSVVYVDRVYVDGNTYTKEDVIRREVLLKEGDIFSASRLRRSVERIYNLGFLEDVQVDLQQPRSPSKADLVFNVAEGKPGILSAGAGFSSVDGVLGTLQVQHINLFGRAHRLNLMWEFGQRKQNYEIGWTNPWFLGKPMSFGVDVFNTTRLLAYKNDLSGFRKGTKGFGLRLGPRLSEHLSLIHNYNYELVRIYDVDPFFADDPALKESEDVTSSLTNGIVHDTRDNVFDANRGMYNRLSVQVAGGPLQGDIDYYRPEAQSVLFIPTFWKFVFSLSARGGYIRPFGDSQDVRVTDRFRVGGVDTVRGYDLDEIGPSDYGRVMMVFNAEYKFPIVQERNRTILQGAFFADVGGGWSRANQTTLRIGSRENEMRAGVGFGIRFKTPVFPIRLDWGYGLNHRPGEQVSQFYFTIGNIF
jgi:outer membrane protein insertion porin family